MSSIILRLSTKIAAGIPLLVSEKKSIVSEIDSIHTSVQDVARKYNLKENTIRKWRRMVSDNRVMRSDIGRPIKWDDISVSKISEIADEKRKKQNCLNVEEFNELLGKEAIETKKRRGENDLAVDFSKTSKKRLFSEIRASAVAGQTKTAARAKAEADPRNSYTEACMFKAYQDGIDPNLIANMDASQYFSRFGNDCEQQLVYIKDESDVSPVTKTEENSGDMGLFLKSYTYGTASGCMGPMVIVLADDSLDPSTVIVKKIVGITHLPDATAYGYIIFTKTRAANKEFYRWYIINVMIPYIESNRESNELNDMMSFVSTDGEQLFIEVCMEDDISNAITEAKIYQVKHSASYSSKGNAWDAGNYFKATKKRTQTMIRKEVENSTYSLRRRLDSWLATEHTHISKAYRDHITDAICRLVTSCQKTINRDIIRNGFINTGQWSLDGSFSFDKKMSCCTTTISDKDMKVMREKFDTMVELMKSNGGYLTEVQMDYHGIMKVDNDTRRTVKDERHFHQQRSRLLNTPESIAIYNNNFKPTALAPESRETAAQRKKREKLELVEAIKAARQETILKQKEMRKRESDEKKQERVGKKQEKKAKLNVGGHRID